MSEVTLEPIGFLKSCYPDKFGTPRQPGLAPSAWAELKFTPKWQPELSLIGLEGFSHLWLIFLFHKNDESGNEAAARVFRPKVHPPRMGGSSIGVFATRSPHRPNPIGLSLVKIERIEDGKLFVSGVDLVDGTPILDIKPYLPQVESKPDALTGWTSDASEARARVEWSEQALADLGEWEKREPGYRLRALVEETLGLDPRPLIYRGYEGKDASKYRSQHAVRLADADVHFEFLDKDLVRVLFIRL